MSLARQKSAVIKLRIKGEEEDEILAHSSGDPGTHQGHSRID